MRRFLDPDMEKATRFATPAGVGNAIVLLGRVVEHIV